MDLEARAWTTQLSRAESDISQATQRLEKVFKEANSQSVQSGEPKIPDPVKLVRRLTALEIALGNLKQDCQVISTKRNDIVQSVMDAQLKTVTQVQEMLEMTQSLSLANEMKETEHEGESWKELTGNLKQQHDLLVTAENKDNLS